MRVTIKVRQESGEFTLTDVRGETLSIENELGVQVLRDLRAGLDRDLDDFITIVSGDLKVKDMRRAAEALKVLLKRGRLIGNYLLSVGRGNDQRERVKDFFLRCCPNWLTVDPLRTILAPPLLEVESHEDHIVPLELVPFFDFSEPEPSQWQTWEGLEAIMRRLPVFSMVIKRRSPSLKPVTCLRLKNGPSLRLKLFHHAGLAYGSSEAEFFQENTPIIEIEGPWPSTSLHPSKFIEQFVRHVTSSSRTFDELTCERIDQVHHFACHAEFDRALPDKSSLILAHASGEDKSISLNDLLGGMMTLQSEMLDDSVEMPFVFLNACEGAVMYAGSASFAKFFLKKNGNRGFLSTECKIPNRVAALFASLFYKFLLSGYSVGHALYLAKWQLFKDHHTPLGALYTLYGSTDLRVTNPVHNVTCLNGE